MTDFKLTESQQAAISALMHDGKIVRRYLKAVEMGEDPGDLSTLADQRRR